MDCKELTTPPLLVRLFREKIDKELNRIFSCFYESYYPHFVSMTYTMSQQFSLLKSDPEYFASQAFSNALLVFYKKISDTGFTEGNATLKTLFLKFCRYQLLAITAKEIREDQKLVKFTKDTALSAIMTAEYEGYSERELLLQEALDLMDEKRRKYIVLRKMYNLSNEEIAARTGVAPGTVNNEVHRSFLHLKKIIDSLRGKST